MGSSSSFSVIIADVFPCWRCVNTHLNTPDQQPAKAFSGAHTDDQLIND